MLSWYAANGRDLPWRRTRDPYRVLVSEVMLQQTQVDRVIPKYREFLREYPTLGRLARADAQDVRKLWYPLGYNARPFRLHQIARETMASYGGRLPDRVEDLRRLPGVGRYTAGAVLAFAYGRDVAVLDTNVRRVLTRVFMGVPRAARARGTGETRTRGVRQTHTRGVRETRTRGDRVFWELAEALVPRGRGYDFNQALMDFGATWCSPRKPKCAPCPMRGFCASYPFPARQ